jgi:hypothetical protein
MGWEVRRGSRDPGKLDAWRKDAGEHATTGDFAETAAFGDVVVLAVKGSAAEKVVETCSAKALSGKTVLDTTNPIAEAAPKDGVLEYFTGPNESLMERLQAIAPAARFVKCFSCVGSAHMFQPDFGGTKPTMFLCGDDPEAKKTAVGVLGAFGWDWADMGGARAARAIEPLAMLWCIPGFREDRWDHAFRLLRR